VLSLSPLCSLALPGVARDPPWALPCLWLSQHPINLPPLLSPLFFVGEFPDSVSLGGSEQGLALQCSWWRSLLLLMLPLLCSSVQNQVDEVIDVMQENITKVIERGERLDDLQDKSGAILNAVLLAFSQCLFPVAGPGYLVLVQNVPNDRPGFLFLSFFGAVFPSLGLQI